MSEQPPTGEEPADEKTQQDPQAQHPHVVTEGEAAVDDALGSTDNPH